MCVHGEWGEDPPGEKSVHAHGHQDASAGVGVILWGDDHGPHGGHTGGIDLDGQADPGGSPGDGGSDGDQEGRIEGDGEGGQGVGDGAPVRVVVNPAEHLDCDGPGGQVGLACLCGHLPLPPIGGDGDGQGLILAGHGRQPEGNVTGQSAGHGDRGGGHVTAIGRDTDVAISFWGDEQAVKESATVGLAHRSPLGVVASGEDDGGGGGGIGHGGSKVGGHLHSITQGWGVNCQGEMTPRTQGGSPLSAGAYLPSRTIRVTGDGARGAT